MVRTVVYDSPEVQTHYAALADKQTLGLVAPLRRRTLRAEALQTATRSTTPPAAPPPASGSAAKQDTIPTKLVKYVPVEVVSVFAAGFAAFNPTGNWVWFGLTAGAIVNVFYLFTVAATANDGKTPRPRVYFYALSALAFVVWGIATISSIQTAMDLSVDKAAYILVAGTFGIPLLDSFFTVIEKSLPWPSVRGAAGA